MIPLFAFITTVILIGVKFDSQADREEVIKNGIRTLGEVVYVSDVENVTINGDHPQKVGFTFEDADQTKSSEQIVFFTNENVLDVGDFVPIAYYDKTAVLMDFEVYVFGNVIQLVFFVFCLLGSIFLMLLAVKTRRDMDMYSRGIPTIGELHEIEHNRMSPFFRKPAQHVLYYSYCDQAGDKYSGSSLVRYKDIPRSKDDHILSLLIHPDMKFRSLYISQEEERLIRKAYG
jgi:hypothetical protein